MLWYVCSSASFLSRGRAAAVLGRVRRRFNSLIARSSATCASSSPRIRRPRNRTSIRERRGSTAGSSSSAEDAVRLASAIALRAMLLQRSAFAQSNNVRASRRRCFRDAAATALPPRRRPRLVLRCDSSAQAMRQARSSTFDSGSSSGARSRASISVRNVTRSGAPLRASSRAGEAAESLELSDQELRPDLHLLCGRPADALAEVVEHQGGAVHQRNWRLHGELGGEGWEVHGHPAV